MADADLLERTDLETQEGDEEKFAHYAEAASVTEGYVMGLPFRLYAERFLFRLAIQNVFAYARFAKKSWMPYSYQANKSQVKI